MVVARRISVRVRAPARSAAIVPAVAAFAACLIVPPPARADDLDAVMQALAARRHGEVEFVEQHFLALLKRPVESSGELIYDAPGRLEKRTLHPHAESLILADDDVLTVQRGRTSRVLDLHTHPELLPFVESLRATLAGDRGALERNFKLSFTGSLARWNLTLVPLDAGGAAGGATRVANIVAQITIDGSSSDLLEIDIRQADGDHSLMMLGPHATP